MQPFFAMITPVQTPGLPGQPPGIWGPTDPRPTPPIVLPIPPDGLAPGVPTHPIYIPVFPAHPIVIPPSAIAPGVPTHPIYLPPIIWGPPGPWPTPPIFIPPDFIAPGVPTHPIYLPVHIWGGGNEPFPTPPIHIPPTIPPVVPPPPDTDPPPIPPPEELMWEQGYVPSAKAWQWVLTQKQQP